jgi:aryl carrier-like protein
VSRTRAHTRARALHTMPTGVDRLSLMCWAEWRRQGVAVAELARRAGYDRWSVDRLLSGRRMRHRALVAADVWQVLEARLRAGVGA